MPNKDTKQTVEDLLAQIDQLSSLKEQAIQLLLEERNAIDEKLARLGYMEGQQPTVKKRKRATKAEMEARRAAVVGAGE
jgi:hypothetical protein